MNVSGSNQVFKGVCHDRVPENFEKLSWCNMKYDVTTTYIDFLQQLTAPAGRIHDKQTSTHVYSAGTCSNSQKTTWHEPSQNTGTCFKFGNFVVKVWRINDVLRYSAKMPLGGGFSPGVSHFHNYCCYFSFAHHVACTNVAVGVACEAR